MKRLGEDQAKQVLERLIERTRQGRLEWTPWPLIETDLVAATTRFNYYIGPELVDTDKLRLEVWQLNGAGEGKAALVETLSTDTAPLADLITTLHRLAEQDAREKDTLPDEILEDLS